MKVGITRKIMPEASRLLVKSGFEVKVWEQQLSPTREQLVSFASDCDALITMLSDRLDASFLASCPKLKAISNYAVGYDNIDLNICNARNIKVGNTPDVLTEATAELALALTLTCTRNILSSNRHTLEGDWKTWEPMGHLGMALKNKTLGIFGMGRIGSEYARKMYHAFDMHVLYVANHRKEEVEKSLKAEKVSLETLAKNSDVISIHAPLTEQTKHLFDGQVFKLMKPTAFLINTARGELINQDHLYEALNKAKIAGAALDVTTPEPLPLNHPLYTCKNLVITPHIGSATREARQEMAVLAAKNIINGLQDREMVAPVN